METDPVQEGPTLDFEGLLLSLTQSLDFMDPLPFPGLSSRPLQHELWPGGALRWTVPMNKYWPRSRDRGNYVKGYVHSQLRIKAKAERLRVTWKLEAMWTYLPNELISLIFGFVHPLDLYHAICTTKGLRNFLLNKGSMSIWKESFLNHPNIPFYPDDVSPPKWVSLMFGPATCDNCGRDNSLVEYALRIRNCDNCSDYRPTNDEELRAAIVPIIEDFDGRFEDIWNVAVKINRFSTFQYPDASYYFHPGQYSISQAVEAAHNMREYLLDIRSGTRDAQSRYEIYLTTTKASNEVRHMHAKLCNLWANDIFNRSRGYFIDSIFAFLETASNILLKRGHNPKDVVRLKDEFRSAVYGRDGWGKVTDTRLSRSKIPKYLPFLEWLAAQCKGERIREEFRDRVYSRKREVTKFYYHTAKRRFSYLENSHIPLPEMLFGIEFFRDYINDTHESIIPFDRAAARLEVLRFINTFTNATKRLLLKLMLDAGVLPVGTTEDSNPEEFLGLAIAVFESHDRVLVGWDEAGAHIYTRNGSVLLPDIANPQFSFSFSVVGYQVLRNLAGLLNLDSLASVLPEQLDALNRRFICKSGSLARKATGYGLPALTWRECLQSPSVAEFDVLSDTLTPYILRLEEPFPPSSMAGWTCKHCRKYIKPLTKLNAIKHVFEVHGVSNATDGVDFTLIRSDDFPTRDPYFVRLDLNANHRCLRCPVSTKLWNRKIPDLDEHLYYKHNIEPKNSVKGVDWLRIQAVEDENWIGEKLSSQGS